MSTDHISEFESSLRGTASAVERVEADGFGTALEEHVEPPAAGALLPFEGVSYGGVPVEPLTSASTLRGLKTGVTAAGLGIADYGTVTVRSTPGADELVSLYPERHVAVVAASDVVADVPAAFERIAGEIEAESSTREEAEAASSTHVLETGPSTTADMGTLVEGVHGPEDVRVILLEDR